MRPRLTAKSHAPLKKIPIQISLLIYMIALLLVWTYFDLALLPGIVALPRGGNTIALVLELMIWTVPALLLMHVYDHELYASVHESFVIDKHALKCTALYMGVAIMVNLLVWATNAHVAELDLHLEGHTLIESVLLIGVTEEIVFRGWILNAYAHEVGPWNASFIAECVLLLIHLPAWWGEGILNTPAIFWEIVKVFALGIGYGYAFKKSHCLWTSIINHMTYNFMQALLFGAAH